jgi:hypothetical protein
MVGLAETTGIDLKNWIRNSKILGIALALLPELFFGVEETAVGEATVLNDVIGIEFVELGCTVLGGRIRVAVSEADKVEVKLETAIDVWVVVMKNSEVIVEGCTVSVVRLRVSDNGQSLVLILCAVMQLLHSE